MDNASGDSASSLRALEELTVEETAANPLAAMPGAAMGYAGIGDKEKRMDLIAYLEWANQFPECCKLSRRSSAN